MAYATVADVEERWRTLTDDERRRAEALLDDAEVMLSSMVSVDEADERQRKALRVVSVNMVVRSLSVSTSDAYGVSQTSMTGGPYTESWTFANPTGDMYVTKAEKRLLHVGGGRAGWSSLGGGRDD